ncbi:hypothetical protein ACTVCO_07880 [Sanguibacter sp. A247]|uniref:hypothetical protein n=1 Tax=unclassified Sanguibacter TaxID=2645534 RepID=UPI003FD833FA
MPATLLAAPAPAPTAPAPTAPAPTTAAGPVRPAPTRSMPSVGLPPHHLPGRELVRSLFGPAIATVEELVARDIEAFTARRLARHTRASGPAQHS